MNEDTAMRTAMLAFIAGYVAHAREHANGLIGNPAKLRRALLEHAQVNALIRERPYHDVTGAMWELIEAELAKQERATNEQA